MGGVSYLAGSLIKETGIKRNPSEEFIPGVRRWGVEGYWGHRKWIQCTPSVMVGGTK